MYSKTKNMNLKTTTFKIFTTLTQVFCYSQITIKLERVACDTITTK